ncbi:MAG: elongation factor G [Chitinivibrionales bacterium]|nr:elongation factor G [Chitinivibrionales bacterium]
MKQYDAKSIRNVCLLSHGGVGKTTLLEALCYTAGMTKKQGRVDAGNSIFDTRSDEKERKMTISMALGVVEWNDSKINFIDTPGFLDLLGDARAALRVVENAIVLVDATAGIQVGTELVSRLIDEHGVKRMFFINGMDKENADFEKTLAAIKETYGTAVAPLQIPLGQGQSFNGVIDLITKQAYEYTSEGPGKGKKIAIPAQLAEKVDTIRTALIETVAESDEELMNKFFEAGELTENELRKGLAVGIKKGLISPLLCGCAIQNIGTDQLLNSVIDFLCTAASREDVASTNDTKIVCASNQPTAAFVFKTLSEEHLGEVSLVRVFSGTITVGQDLSNMNNGQLERMGNVYFLRGNEKLETPAIPTGDIGALLKLKDTHTNDTLAEKNFKLRVTPTVFDEPVVNVAISAKVKADEEKIGAGLKKLHEEDKTFSFKFQPDIRQSILSTRGDIHTEILIDALRYRFKVEVERKPPKISYRETITKSVKYVEYTHKKQSGGAGQFGRVFIDLDPAKRGEGYEFLDKIVGGVIDGPFRPSVDKGVRSKLQEGILAGYPIVDVKVSLVDGKTHPVDSKDIAFQIAGREAFKKAFEMASPILLEPIVDLSVTVPEEYTGDVMGDLSSRRGKIMGMNPEGKFQTIKAKVPEAEIQTYSQSLRSMTQGRGFYSKSFSHYDPVPNELAQRIIEASKAETAQNQ